MLDKTRAANRGRQGTVGWEKKQEGEGEEARKADAYAQREERMERAAETNETATCAWLLQGGVLMR